MPAPYSKDSTASELVRDFASQIEGKVILTTGVSPGGLGAAFVESIAQASPKLLILAGRNLSKAEETAKKIGEVNPKVATRTLKLDLSSFKQVRDAAAEVNSYSENVDVLVNNAGIMAVPYSKTEDGYESQLQCNHLSHFLFTNLIMDKILASGSSPRIINISSDGHRLGHIRYYDYNFHDGESYNRWASYGQSKSANMLFSEGLAARLGSKGLLSYSLHPGVIWTNLGGHLSDFDDLVTRDKELGMESGWGEFQFTDLDHGAATHVYAAFSPAMAKEPNGSYLESCAVIDPEIIHPWSVGEREARKCWALSEKLVGKNFPY